MKQRIVQLILLSLIFCLLTVLAACGSETKPTVPNGQTVPVTTKAPRHMPELGPDRLELDGADLGPVYLLDGVGYVELKEITVALELKATEAEDSVLKLTISDETVMLRDGSHEAEGDEGQRRLFTAPVLKGDGSWYLPVSALESLWGWKLVYDVQDAVFRCFTLEQGPALRINGADAGESLMLGNCSIFQAGKLVDLTAWEQEQGTDENGTPVLTIRNQDHVLRFLSGSCRADLDGEPLELSVPAFVDGETWYLPESVMESLGCAAWVDDSGRIELWQFSEGPSVWVDGSCLDSVLCGDTVCAFLTALSDATGSDLEQTEEGLILISFSNRLGFQIGSTEVNANGKPFSLPIPVLPYGEDWLVPVEPTAEALQLPRAEGDRLIYSRIEPLDTVIWVNGKEATSYAREQNTLYFHLNDVFFFESNEAVFEPNKVDFTAFDQRISLTGGSAAVRVDGDDVELIDPVCNDGENWYAPTRLLTALGLSEMKDPELDQIYYTHIVRHDELKDGYRVPVLMYHAVSDDIWGIPELFVSPSALEKQLQALTEGGYTAITFEDLDHIDEIEKPVMLTFDDGYDDNYTDLFPLLKQYNVKATVFVIVNDLGKNHKLTKAQVKEMSDSGLVSIQSHTMSHNYLDAMSEKQLIREHYDSMLALARITGKQPFVMCYPTGKNSGYSRNITAEYYEYGLCMGGPCWVTGDAPYRIYRYYIPRKTTVETFLQYLEG